MMTLRAVSFGLLVSQIGAIPALQPYASTPPSAVLPSVASTSTATASSQLDQLASFALNVTTEKVSNRTTQKRDGCTRHKLRVRREWRTLSNPQRRAFIDAILCLQQLPSQTPPEFAPGAKTRYDDFIATHINQTAQIHFTVRSRQPRFAPTDSSLNRERFSDGIGISSGSSSKRCATSAATQATSRKYTFID